MNNSKEHSKLVDDILFAVGSIPDVRAFSRRVGLATPLSAHRPIYFGVKGEADIQGFMKWYTGQGCYVAATLAIECKTGKGKLTKDQKAWRDMFMKLGGIYIEAHSTEEALDGIRDKIALNRRMFAVNHFDTRQGC